MTTTVLLVGARGYGASHRRNLERLGDRVQLLGLVDPADVEITGFGADARRWKSLPEAFESGIRPDVVIVATPTGTHLSLATLALEHGSDVYVEKPPVVTMEQFEQLQATQQRTGRAVQVGFQSFGSHAFADIAARGAAPEQVTAVAAWGAWVRDAAYWTRSSWAGKRTLDGVPVVDGVVTNPFAHAVATALRLAGARRVEDVASVEVELLRANDIESDDTSSVRITLTDGRIVAVALTLCADTEYVPVIAVQSPAGEIRLAYTEDRIEDASGVSTVGRTDLFEELLDHRDHGTALSSPLEESGAFMTVLEAVRTAPDPRPIPADRFAVAGDGLAAHPVIPDAAAWVEKTARAGALYSEVDAPFAG